jgi:hypothetical protein
MKECAGPEKSVAGASLAGSVTHSQAHIGTRAGRLRPLDRLIGTLSLLLADKFLGTGAIIAPVRREVRAVFPSLVQGDHHGAPAAGAGG